MIINIVYRAHTHIYIVLISNPRKIQALILYIYIGNLYNNNII